MINLILKDIMVLKKTLLFCAIYPAIFIFAFQSTGSAMLPASIAAVTYILVLTASAYDDKNKSDILLNSLPIGRNQVVLSRYLSIYVFSAIGIIYYMVFYILINISGLPLKVYPITSEGIIAALFSVTLLNSIYFPILFKMGYIKSKMVNFILFFSLFFGVSAVSGLLENKPGNGTAKSKFLESITRFFNSLSNVQITIGIIIIMFIMFLISYMLSKKFYKNREF